MRKHPRLSARAARSRLAAAMKTLDAHIEAFANATQTDTANALVLTLSLAAINVATGRCTREQIADHSKNVATALGISQDVTDAFVDFQIATTELCIATGGRR